MHYPYRYSSIEGEIKTEAINVDLDTNSNVLSFVISFPNISEPMTFGPSENYHGEQLPNIDEDELGRRFPEINLIPDVNLKNQVVEILLEDLPPYYWRVPASGSGKHHPVDERGIHGQWIHTKRVTSVFHHISHSGKALNEYIEDNPKCTDIIDYRISQEEYGYGIAAALLHDIFKFGRATRPSEKMDPLHDLTGARYLFNHRGMPGEITCSIEAHNGPWGGGSAPRNFLELFIHLSDMVASDYLAETLLIEPTPEVKFAQLQSRFLCMQENPDDYTIKVLPTQEDVLPSE